MIWDKESDIQMWINAWYKTILNKTKDYACKLIPGYSVNSILEFTKTLKNN